MVGIFFCFKKSNELSEVKVQIVQVDNSNNEEKIIKEYIKKKGEIVDLESIGYYDCDKNPNNIKILKITKNFVKISRNRKAYRLIGEYKGKRWDDPNIKMYSLVNGKDYEGYTEEVIDNVKYKTKTSFSIDQTSPNSPECSQSRYTLFVQFSK